MVDDEMFSDLLDFVEANIQGARPVEDAAVRVLVAILAELRTSRKENGALRAGLAQMVGQFDQVSAGGNAIRTETGHG